MNLLRHTKHYIQCTGKLSYYHPRRSSRPDAGAPAAGGADLSHANLTDPAGGRRHTTPVAREGAPPSGRALARAPVGGGFPAPPFR